MSKTVKLLGLSGSLRKESLATAILKTLVDAILPHATMSIGEVGTLPLYNADLDNDHSPLPVATMRDMLKNSDGLVIVSPEYNHGMTGVIKNALDWLSSPPGTAALIGKPTLVITSSPAFTGGVRAQAQLLSTLSAARACPLIRDEVIIASANNKITGGRLTDKASLDFALRAMHDLIKEATK